MQRLKRRVATIGRSRYARFGLVGIINTSVDFGIFNVLVLMAGLPIILANIIATTAAMLVSFTLNKNGVFKSDGKSHIQIILFFATTLTGIWIIQNGAILLLYPLLGNMPIALKLNIIKAIAIMIGLVWNYLWYSQVVFNEERSTIPGKFLAYCQKHWKLTVLVAVIIAVVIALVMSIGQSVWFDEGYSIMLAQRPVHDLLALTRVDAHPPFYYLYLKAWGSLFGWSELALRLSSILPGAASIGLIALTLRRMFSAKLAIISLPFLTLAPFLIRYDYEIRMYSLVLLLGALATYLLVRARENNSSRWWLGYAAVITLGMYTLYLSLVIWIGHALWLLYADHTQKINPIKQKHWLYFIGAAILFLPWLPTVIYQLQNSALPPYMSAIDIPVAANLVTILFAYTPVWDGNIIAIALATLFLGLFTWAFILIRRRLTKKEWVNIMLFVFVFFGALAFYFIISVPPNPPRFTDRYLAHPLIFFYALVGIVIATSYRLKLRRIAWALVIVSIATSVYGLISLYQHGNYNFQRLQPVLAKQVRADADCPSTTIVTSGAYGYIDTWYDLQGCDLRYYQPAELTYTGGYAPMNALNTTKRVKQSSDLSTKQVIFLYYDDSTEFMQFDNRYQFVKSIDYQGLHLNYYRLIKS